MSDLIKCPNGHYYDSASNKQCPYCNQKNDPDYARNAHLFASVLRLKDDSKPRHFGQPREETKRGEWGEDANHCPKCQKRYLDVDDRYCRFCGSERTGVPGRYFVPYPEFMEIVYGPMPVTVYYSCPNCGNQWEGSNWETQYYCPSCGASVSGTDREPSKPAFRKIRLTMLDDDHVCVDCTIGEKKTTFGRLNKSDVVLNKYDKSLSRVHFYLMLEHEELYICDSESTNGTYVNDKRLRPYDPTALKSGDVINAGKHDYRITF